MIVNLQVLRALAAWMVFLHHYVNTVSHEFPGLRVIGFGAAGVDIFFVLSGFIMYLTTVGTSTEPLSFMTRRFFRVIPAYWLMTFLFCGIVAVGFQPVGVMYITPEFLVKSLLFVPFVRDGFVEPIVSVGWTLNYEMFFYLIFSFMLFLRSDVTRVICLLSLLVGLPVAGSFVDAGFFWSYYTNPIIMEFGLGVLIAYLYARGKLSAKGSVSAPYALVASGAVLIAIAQVYTLANGLPAELHGFVRPLIWGGAGCSIVVGALILEVRGHHWKSAVLRQQGDSSYSFYLLHSLMLHFAAKVSGFLGASGIIGAIVVLVVAASTGVASSAIMYRFVELGVSSWLRRLWSRLGMQKARRA